MYKSRKMKSLHPVRTAGIALVVVALTLAGCGSSTRPDAGAAGSAGPATTGGATYAIVSNADVATGFAALMPLAATAAAKVAANSDDSEAAVNDMYTKWFEFEGTVRKNDESVYLDMEDALVSVKAGQKDNDAAKASKGAAALVTLTATYLAKFPADGATAVAAPALGASTQTVLVGLNEWKIDVPDTIAHGIVTLSLTNKGKEIHEFVVFRTDLAVADLPLDAEGGVDEKGTGVQLVDEHENLKPGTGADLKVDLPPGKYVFVCNMLGHFKHGMVKQVIVT